MLLRQNGLNLTQINLRKGEDYYAEREDESEDDSTTDTDDTDNE